jgi:hypothetical protein
VLHLIAAIWIGALAVTVSLFAAVVVIQGLARVLHPARRAMTSSAPPAVSASTRAA